MVGRQQRTFTVEYRFDDLGDDIEPGVYPVEFTKAEARVLHTGETIVQVTGVFIGDGQDG